MQENPGKMVVGRHLLTSHEGKGIELITDVNNIPECPLYTEYIKKKSEFRVHIFDNKVIRVQQKKRKLNFQGEVNNQIRNTSGGWIFATENVSIPEEVLNECSLLLYQFGCFFGAFDIIYNEYYNKWYVIECNSAPGIRGTTVKVYGDAIREFLKKCQ
jgi:glutathione synthase/RimK-type ligase-like ATP-grasp enzyme